MQHNTKAVVQGMQAMGDEFNKKDMQEKLGEVSLKRLCLNENPYGPTPKIMQALDRFTLEEAASYPDPYQSDLRQAICDFHQVDADQVIFTNGLDEIIQLLPRTFIKAGDEVLAHMPSFYEYQNQAAVDGGIFIGVPALDNGHVDWQGMQEAISPKTKLVYLCTPNNPTGLRESVEDIKHFLDQLPPTVVALVDEAYIEFLDRPEEASMMQYLKDYPQLGVMRTFSKAYGLANIRLGYTVLSKANAAALNVTRTPFNISGLKEHIALEALKDQAYLRQVVAKIAKERQKWFDHLDKLGLFYYPSETNFILFKLEGAQAFVDQALDLGYQLATHQSPEWIRLSMPKASDGGPLRHALQDFVLAGNK